MRLRIPSAGVRLGPGDIAHALVTRSAAGFADALAARLGTRHVGLTSGGSAALYLILKALSARSEQREVVVPAYTAPVVLLPIQRAGLKPVFADVSLETFNIDMEQASGLVGPRTLALMPVHMFGIPCDMEKARAAAAAAGAAVIEDAASALGASVLGKPTGTLGDAGFFSFHRGKQLSTVIGGAWVTSDDALAAAVAHEAETLPRTSVTKRAGLLLKLVGLSLAVRPIVYTVFHPVLARFKDVAPHTEFPLFAFTAMQAGAGLSQLKRLDRTVAARNERALRAREVLADATAVRLPTVPQGAVPSFNHFPVLLPDAPSREAALAATLNAGVECTKLYDATVYQAYHLRPEEHGGPCPRAEELASRLLLIPCHPLIPIARVEQAAEVVKQTVSG